MGAPRPRKEVEAQQLARGNGWSVGGRSETEEVAAVDDTRTEAPSKDLLVAVAPEDRGDALVLAVVTLRAGLQWDGEPMPNADYVGKAVTRDEIREHGAELVPSAKGLRSALRRLEASGVVEIEKGRNGSTWRIAVVPEALRRRQARGCPVARIPEWHYQLGLAPRDLIVAGLLHGFRGEAKHAPTAERLSECTGYKTSSIWESFARLRERGLLDEREIVVGKVHPQKVRVGKGKSRHGGANLLRKRMVRTLREPDRCQDQRVERGGPLPSAKGGPSPRPEGGPSPKPEGNRFQSRRAIPGEPGGVPVATGEPVPVRTPAGPHVAPGEPETGEHVPQEPGKTRISEPSESPRQPPASNILAGPGSVPDPLDELPEEIGSPVEPETSPSSLIGPIPWERFADLERIALESPNDSTATVARVEQALRDRGSQLAADLDDPRKKLGLLVEILTAAGISVKDVGGNRKRVDGLRRARVDLGRRLLERGIGPEEIADWISRAFRVGFRHPRNVGAFLWSVFDRSDFEPWSLLGSESKNRLGRYAEDWRDFSQDVEQAREGEHRETVRAVVDVLAVTVSREFVADVRSKLILGDVQTAGEMLLAKFGDALEREPEEVRAAVGCDRDPFFRRGFDEARRAAA
jgi:hypothetical protein